MDDSNRQISLAEPDSSRRRSPLWLGLTERLITAAVLSGTLWSAVAWAMT